MDTVEVSTAVRVPPEDAYAFLLDVPGYAEHSEHLAVVAQHGDGGPGTEYDLELSWWTLTQTVRCRVTSTDEPREIAWEAIGALDAHGTWTVSETADGSRVTLTVTYDADSGRTAIDLPALASLDWVVDKLTRLAESEGERTVERAVADLEGERRSVELTVETS